MRLRQAVFGLIALVVLGIAFGVGRYFQPQPRPITLSDHQIRVASASSGCEVNTPVVVMHYPNDRIQWLSNDYQYTIDFTKIDPPSNSPPLPPGYVKETPLDPPDNPVTIDKNHPSRFFHVKHQAKYYYYAIYGQSQNLCKISTDDHDTGLNVKP